MLLCSTSLHHCARGKSGLVVAVPARKWFFHIFIATSAAFLECFPFGVSWYSTSLFVM